MDTLPNEVIVNIFRFLPPLDVIRLKKVSRRFDNLTIANRKYLQRCDVYIGVKQEDYVLIVNVHILDYSGKKEKMNIIRIKGTAWETVFNFFHQFKLHHLEADETTGHLTLFQTLLHRCFEEFNVNLQFISFLHFLFRNSTDIFQENIGFICQAINEGRNIPAIFLAYEALRDQSDEDLTLFLDLALAADVRIVSVPEGPNVGAVNTQDYLNVVKARREQFGDDPAEDAIIPFNIYPAVHCDFRMTVNEFCERCDFHGVTGPDKQTLYTWAERKNLPKMVTFSKNEKKITLKFEAFELFSFGTIFRQF